MTNGTRRARLEGFPYAVVYRELSAEEIEIVAVAHLRRGPKYWANRELAAQQRSEADTALATLDPRCLDLIRWADPENASHRQRR